MTKFIYASELKLSFKVFGSYYDLRVNNGGIIKLRNILEIYKREYIAGIGEPIPMFFGKPDAVFVMMNPGSSEPREEGYSEPIFEFFGVKDQINGNRMVKAKPDVTQYQVMRVMIEMGWNHVRVINLSDIREPKSLRFFKKVKDFEENYNDIHTVFSELRRDEIEKVFLMKNVNSPVVLGWGRDKHLIPLAEKAMQFLKEFNTIGIPSKDNPILYLHPSPNIQTAKVKWLEELREKLQ